MSIYKPEHVVNGNAVQEDLVTCPYRDVVNRLKERKTELEEFLSQLKVAKDMEDSMLSPVAGILEQGELDQINKFLGLGS